MIENEFVPRGFKLHDLGGVEVVSGWYRNHVLPRHSHDGLMLSLMCDGVQALRYRGSTHLADAGKVVAVPPNEAHAASPGSDQGWRYYTITIPSEMLRDYRSDGSRFLCDTLISDPSLKQSLAELFRSLGNHSVLAREEALQNVVGMFLRRHAGLSPRGRQRPTEARAVEICKAYLSSRLDQNVSLSDLSQVARIDRFLLVRSFTQIVGIPPHAWHLQRRLDRSLTLLSMGEDIAEVAVATGFSDQAHLTRLFKRFTGITPGRFRKDNLSLQLQLNGQSRASWPIMKL